MILLAHGLAITGRYTDSRASRGHGETAVDVSRELLEESKVGSSSWSSPASAVPGLLVNLCAPD
jgi:hypothetical protein